MPAGVVGKVSPPARSRCPTPGNRRFMAPCCAPRGHSVRALHMSSENYHEPYELLSESTRCLHRAIVSLKEELEAIDWYQQRADACTNDELRTVLLHNKNEEIEHAMMTLEWLRRSDPVFAANIATYLGSTGPITEVETLASAGTTQGTQPSAPASLGIGSLKGLL